MTGRTRALLVVLGLAAVGALAFWLHGRGDDQAAAGDSRGAAPGTATGGSAATRAPVDPRSGAVAGTGPRTRGPDEIDDGDGNPDTRTYIMDNGAVVRDHRGSGYPPPMAPPAMRPDRRTMNPQLTAKIYLQLAPAVAACGAAVPAADRGADPFVYVTMTVQVAAGSLTTTDVYPTIHDVNGTSASTFPDCVAEKARAITVASGDEPDHDDYVVQYPIRLR